MDLEAEGYESVDNAPSGSVECIEFLDKPSEYNQPLKKSCTPRSQLIRVIELQYVKVNTISR
jgi:hypothetical protein